MGLSLFSFFVHYALVGTQAQHAQHATMQRWPDVIFDDFILQHYDANGVLVEKIVAQRCEYFSARKYSVLHHFMMEYPLRTGDMVHSVQGDVATREDQKDGTVLVQGHVHVVLNQRSSAR